MPLMYMGGCNMQTNGESQSYQARPVLLNIMAMIFWMFS